MNAHSSSIQSLAVLSNYLWDPALNEICPAYSEICPAFNEIRPAYSEIARAEIWSRQKYQYDAANRLVQVKTTAL